MILGDIDSGKRAKNKLCFLTACGLWRGVPFSAAGFEGLKQVLADGISDPDRKNGQNHVVDVVMRIECMLCVKM